MLNSPVQQSKERTKFLSGTVILLMFKVNMPAKSTARETTIAVFNLILHNLQINLDSFYTNLEEQHCFSGGKKTEQNILLQTGGCPENPSFSWPVCAPAPSLPSAFLSSFLWLPLQNARWWIFAEFTSIWKTRTVQTEISAYTRSNLGLYCYILFLGITCVNVSNFTGFPVSEPVGAEVKDKVAVVWECPESQID